MKIRTKLTGLLAGALLLSLAAGGACSVHQYRNDSVRRAAADEREKMELAKWALEQTASQEELESMVELARIAYLQYQFEKCYQEGYVLMADSREIRNLTDYQVLNGDVLGEDHRVQKVEDAYLLLMRMDLEYPEGFWVMAVRDITDVWTAARGQALQYLAVAGAAFAAVFLISAGILRRMLRVLEQLKDQAGAISRGDFSIRTQADTGDELAELSDSINRMSEQLRQQIEDLHLLLGAMAHETKTPVTSIIGYADSLLHVSLDEGQKERALEAISRSAWRLDELSGKLMQLIGLYQDQALSMEPLFLPELLSQSCERLSGIFPQVQIRLETDPAWGDQGSLCQGDRTLLGILFDNLLVNAAKAMEGTGRLTAGCRGRAVWVEDEGCGIPEEDLPHVCKPFYMADKSRARKLGGSGLGLAVSERIVKAHHARMEIQSQVGIGTRVTVEFQDASAEK